MTEKAGARNEKNMCQGSGRTMRKPAQKEMKKIGQRIKQEQKRKSVGRTSLINFLKRKVLTMTVKRGQEMRGYHAAKEGPKKINKDFRENK